MQQAMKSRVGLQTYDVSIVLFSFWDTLTELSSSGPPQYVVTPYFFFTVKTPLRMMNAHAAVGRVGGALQMLQRSERKQAKPPTTGMR